MERNEHDKITAFDTLYTTNHIQMLKVVMPYFEHSIRKTLAVYIKYLEFRYALSYCNSHPYELCGCSAEKEELNWNKLCSEILPFCNNDEKQQFEQISGLFRSIETYKEMSQMMEMLKDMPGDGTPFGDLSSFADFFPFGMASDNPNTSAGSNDGDTNKDNCYNTEQNDDLNKNNSMNRNNGMMDMLMGMLSPEQKSMFEMFGGNNYHDSE